jgi:hypothetical protein
LISGRDGAAGRGPVWADFLLKFWHLSCYLPEGGPEGPHYD